MTTITKKQVLNLLRNGTSQERLEFLESLPQNSFKDAVASLVGSNNSSIVILALTSLIQQYCEGSAPDYGAVLAEAAHDRAVEICNTIPNHGLNPTTLSNLAYYHVKALSLIGCSEDVIAMADYYIEFYKEFYKKFDKESYKNLENENLPSLKVLKIGALVNLQRIDEAEEALRGDPSLLQHPIVGIEAKRLQGWIDQYRADPTQLRAQARSAPEPPSPQSLLDIMKTAIDLGFEGETGRSLKQQVDQLNLSNSISSISHKKPAEYNQEDLEKYNRMLDILNRGEEFLRKGSSDSELAVRSKIRNASAIFVRGTPAPDVIRHSLSVLKSSLEWANQRGITELKNDALWGIYLCNSRLNHPSEAANALIQLRGNLEGIRRGIKEPLKRGGVFSSYPYLFNALCEHLQKAGRAKDLLEAIESSKGRVIADKLTDKFDAIVSDKAIYNSVKRLPNLTRDKKFHYLTYFVDDEVTYAVLLAKDGSLHSEEILLGKLQIREWLEQIQKWLRENPPPQKENRHLLDPRNWDSNTRKHKKLPEKLAPLVKWLEPLAESGIIQKNDHICYSSDEQLHLIPLHYLPFDKEYLVNYVSLSRIHGAYALIELLKQEPVNPNQFINFQVWAQEDLQSDKMLAAFRQPGEWLQNHLLRGETISGEQADLQILTEQKFPSKIIHFATHGVFPSLEAQEKSNSNPWQYSGLLFAHDGKLPSKVQVLDQFFLSPEQLLKRKLNFLGSHVTMQACVSGLAKEGIGGDALGLELAFFLNGANSLLVSHWNIDAIWAAKFSVEFYQKWLIDKVSRRVAWRETVLKLMKETSEPYYWSAVSLSGDWR